MDSYPVSTDLAPSPGGHYSQGIVYGGLLFISGQLPIKPDRTRVAKAPFEDQCRQALSNVFGILKAAGSSPDRVLKVTAYITAAEHWPAFNAVYAEMFGAHRPARAVVPIRELNNGYLVEIEAIAAVD